MAPDGIPNDIPITFDRTFCDYDKRRQAVLFYAYQGSRTIRCYISREALLDCFEVQGGVASTGDRQDNENDAVGSPDIFEQHRDVIEAKARLYIEAGITQNYRDDDGYPRTEVRLQRKDF